MHYHLIGIGGVGMSGIAHVLNARGESVSGSDRQESDITRRLRAAGVGVYIGHAAGNVDGADLVVYSAAIPRDNPELVQARGKGIPIIERPEMLGRLMEPYEHRISVTGTHGKTTTTTIISGILDAAGVDASVLIGGDVKSMGGNARLGGGSVILTEACEAYGSFLHLHSSIAVITNIEADHLDYYGTIERIEESFRQFADQVDEDGVIVACWDDERVRKVLDGCQRRIVRYGFGAGLDISADNVDAAKPEPTFTLVRNCEALGEVRIGVPGMQNVVNSLAAAGVAFELGIGFEAIREGLAAFRGAGRRFDVLYNDGGTLVIDDYAHHPSEIRATLSGARAAYDKHIIAVFQPHLYSRTRDFLDEFAETLALADEVIVTSIYAAREKPIEGVSAEAIVDRMRENGFEHVSYAPEMSDITSDLLEKIGSGDMVLVIGAGNIRTVGEELAELLGQRAGVYK